MAATDIEIRMDAADLAPYLPLMPSPRTLYEKIWDAHAVATSDEGETLLNIDRHLDNEVTSPQAFEALRTAGRIVRRPDLTIAVADHNVPTTNRSSGVAARLARGNRHAHRQAGQ